MDIPLHPRVVNEIARGRAYLERVSAVSRGITAARTSVACPNEDNTIVFGGYGMVIDAVFTDDIFDRYPSSEELSDLLTAMCQEGYAQVSQQVTALIADAVDQGEPL